MNYEKKYINLLELAVRIVDSEKGKQAPRWHCDTQPLSLKIVFHLCSIYYLFKGTKISKLAGTSIKFIDYSSIIILTRAVLENFLTFYFIFIDPETQKEKQFRHSIWDLGGLIERRKYPVKLEELKIKKQQEAVDIRKTRDEIQKSIFYKKLDNKLQKKARRGEWRLSNSWASLGATANMDEDYVKNAYRYFCSHAHTSSASILQIGQSVDIKKQREMAETCLSYCLVFMSYFISSYVSIFPKTKKILSEYPDVKNLVDEWYYIGENFSEYHNEIS